MIIAHVRLLVKGESVIDKETADIIAAAIWTEEIVNMSLEDLDLLAEYAFANDPDVSFSDLDYVPDAGADLHGVNTDEEMMGTL